MTTCDLLGAEIYICDRLEARALWKKRTDCQTRIWLEEEVEGCLLMTTGAIEAIVAKKVEQPGYVYKA
jgi:hypothetical protein